jgi:hypothetical protein
MQNHKNPLHQINGKCRKNPKSKKSPYLEKYRCVKISLRKTTFGSVNIMQLMFGLINYRDILSPDHAIYI